MHIYGKFDGTGCSYELCSFVIPIVSLSGVHVPGCARFLRNGTLCLRTYWYQIEIAKTTKKDLPVGLKMEVTDTGSAYSGVI